MFHPDRWAQAFVSACGNVSGEGGAAMGGDEGKAAMGGASGDAGSIDGGAVIGLAEAAQGEGFGLAEAGLAALRALFASLSRLPAPVSGAFAARQIDGMIRRAAGEAGFSAALEGGGKAGGLEMARRFILLVVRKGAFQRGGRIIEEIEAILNRERGILKVRVEAALPLEPDFEAALRAALREKMAVQEVLTDIRIVPELLGGCRIFTGSEAWDASLRGQLQRLARDLGAAPVNGRAGGLAGGYAGSMGEGSSGGLAGGYVGSMTGNSSGGDAGGG
jgi:F-type H+-transporting ATPase subunit delta